MTIRAAIERSTTELSLHVKIRGKWFFQQYNWQKHCGRLSTHRRRQSSARKKDQKNNGTKDEEVMYMVSE